MKRLLRMGAVIAVVALTGCTATGEENQPQASTPETAPAEAKVKPRVALRDYTPEQIVQVLRELRDENGAQAAQVLDHNSLQAQSGRNSALQAALTPEVTPENCTPFVNLAPTIEDGLTMGTSLFAAEKMQIMISAAVDAQAGHSKRADANNAAVEQCGDLTMKLAGQEIKMSMDQVSLNIEAENSLAVQALGQAAGNKIHMVSFTANTGSVLISGAAFSSEDFDEGSTLKSLAGMAQDALNRFASLPVSESTVPASPTTPGAGTDSDAVKKLRNAAVGSWVGPVTGDSTAYTVEASIRQTANGLSAEVDYPEIRCKAIWKETTVSGSAISLAESLVSGRCEENVKVTLTKDADTWIATFSSGSGRKIQSVLRSN
ncbi:hypothetical protein [Arthrobacter sp. D3-16]